MSNPIEDIMNGLVESMDRETPDVITYKDFMRADKNSMLYDIFSTYDMAASGQYMIISKIMKQKYGIQNMNDDLYWFIREFPVMIDKMSARIQEEEGPVCCVDKAWSRSFKKLRKLIIASGGVISDEDNKNSNS